MKINRVLIRMENLNPVFILPLLALLTFSVLVAISLILSINQGLPRATNVLQMDEWFEVKGERTVYLVSFYSASVVDNVICPDVHASCFSKPGYKFVVIKYEAINKGSRETTLIINAKLEDVEGRTYDSWYVDGGPLREIRARPGQSGMGQDVFQIPEYTIPIGLNGYFFGFGISNVKFTLTIPQE